ncbi:hypothetical protein K1719_018236 [Acacia pycnantha]|nr:hypothetical protein K1719_018236 [Acacia pycnantha]
MEKANKCVLARTKLDQMVEALKSPSSSESMVVVMEQGRATPSRKSNRRMMGASSGRSGGGKNTHIRKSRSAQLKFELDEVRSGVGRSGLKLTKSETSCVHI